MKGHDTVPGWTSSHLVTSPSLPSHRSKGTNDNSCSEVGGDGDCSLVAIHKICPPFLFFFLLSFITTEKLGRSLGTV